MRRCSSSLDWLQHKCTILRVPKWLHERPTDHQCFEKLKERKKRRVMGGVEMKRKRWTKGIPFPDTRSVWVPPCPGLCTGLSCFLPRATNSPLGDGPSRISVFLLPWYSFSSITIGKFFYHKKYWS